RSGPGSAQVTLGGLPQWASSGTVYTENRAVTASGGSFRDSFGQWGVHVYHFVEPLALETAEPSRATVGSRITLLGSGLAGATAFSFGGAKAGFTVRSDRTLVATVPRQARSGPIVISSALSRVESKSRLSVLPSSPRRPQYVRAARSATLPSSAARPQFVGAPRVGHRLRATTGAWYGDPPTGYQFHWLSCHAAGGSCRQIRGATRRTLRLGPGQFGRRLRLLVIENTVSGSARARSAATPVVSRPLP